MKNKITSFCLSIGLLTLGATGVKAHSVAIDDLDSFYNYYGTNFTPEQNQIIQGIFNNIQPYFGENGLENAIADGYLPFTAEWLGHGVHWFNPQLTNLANLQANPFSPAGLNMSQDGQLLGVFWAQELYQPFASLIQNIQQNIGLENLDQATLTQLYSQYTATTEQPIPNVFNAFPNAQWHQHRNVVIENMGVQNDQGGFDPQIVNFRQSLTDENFIGELLTSFSQPDITLAVLESDNNLDYPFFNRIMTPGFQMLHMWVGQGSHAGLFSPLNSGIPVSSLAISEGATFEDGSGGSSHDGDHGNHGGNPNAQSTPEPSFLLSFLSLGIFSLTKFRQKKQA